MHPLPDFPWNSLAAAKEKAARHPDGLINLSVGAPVDPTPEVVTAALSAASQASGYPTVAGTDALRESIVGYLTRRWGTVELGPDAVLPVIGTKELVGWLPLLVGVRPGDKIVIPECAYPTYDVGGRVVEAQVVCSDDPADAVGAKLVWLNFPANPHGACASDGLLRQWVAACRDVGALLAADECYLEFVWRGSQKSVLHPEICGGSASGILSVQSLSKRSNMAGYRAGFVAGDTGTVAELTELRKHLGMMVPAPVQAAMIAALDDDQHVSAQRDRYRRRRDVLLPALEAAGFRVDDSQGSLYLWVTRDEPCRQTIDWLASRGILAAPGDFYGESGIRHVRVALTASDSDIQVAASRLAAER